LLRGKHKIVIRLVSHIFYGKSVWAVARDKALFAASTDVPCRPFTVPKDEPYSITINYEWTPGIRYQIVLKDAPGNVFLACAKPINPSVLFAEQAVL
jgi:hypothetical protein